MPEERGIVAALGTRVRFILDGLPSDLRRKLLNDLTGAASCATADSTVCLARSEGEWVVTRADGSERRLRSDVGAATYLLHGLNRAVIEHTPYVTFHAGGVVHDGGAVVLPAASGGGKSTLTAGLLRAGCRYLSDEAIGLAENAIEALPYHKPINLEIGSQHLFPELAPSAVGADGDFPSVWHVPVTSTFGADSLAGPTPIHHIVIPSYDPTVAATILEPVGRAEALVELMSHTFPARRGRRDQLDGLAALVGAVPVHRLRSGRLEEAVDAVLGLAGWTDLTPIPAGRK